VGASSLCGCFVTDASGASRVVPALPFLRAPSSSLPLVRTHPAFERPDVPLPEMGRLAVHPLEGPLPQFARTRGGAARSLQQGRTVGERTAGPHREGVPAHGDDVKPTRRVAARSRSPDRLVRPLRGGERPVLVRLGGMSKPSRCPRAPRTRWDTRGLITQPGPCVLWWSTVRSRTVGMGMDLPWS